MIKKILIVLIVLAGAIFWLYCSDNRDNELIRSYDKCQSAYQLNAIPFPEYMRDCMN
jgi:hypothetical protein